MLSGKKIVLALTGGIALYKVCEMVRLLKQQNANVHIAMTRHATEFVTALTFQTLSGNPVFSEEFSSNNGNVIPHIELNKKADLLVVMPATANILGKAANGIADDLVSSLIIARQSPIAFVPAMNVHMWKNPATQRNVKQLKEDGALFFGPDHGFQACGDIGEGRMLEPADVLELIMSALTPKTLLGRHFLISTGATYEPLDPVRGITNLSSGKQGIEIARAARNAGANVSLVLAHSAQSEPVGVKTTRVNTAQEMNDALLTSFDDGFVDAFISVAAVSDWRCRNPSQEKIKKENQSIPKLELIENPDILANIAKAHPETLCIGFAAESENIIENARKKLAKKGISLIFANNAKTALGCDDNELFLVTPTESFSLGFKKKSDLAKSMVAIIGSELNK